MKLGEAIKKCKVRGYISKILTPEIKYYKNDSRTIIERVIKQQRDCMLDNDWENYDIEANETSIIG